MRSANLVLGAVLQTMGAVEPAAGRGILRLIPLAARRQAVVHRPVPIRQDRQVAVEGIRRGAIMVKCPLKMGLRARKPIRSGDIMWTRRSRSSKN